MSINQFSPDFPETLWWTQQQQQQQSLMEQQQQSRPISNTNTQFPNHNKRLFIPPQIYDHHHHHRDSSSVLLEATTEPSDFLEREEESSPSLSLLERESMFEKHLTPSDVGKLNRLVIPKQHAEKYFPLNNNNYNSFNNSNCGGGGGGGGDTVGGGGGGEKGLLLSFEDESGKCWRFRYSYWNSSQSYVLTKGWSRYVKEKRLDAGDVVLFERHRVEMDRFYIGWRRRAALAAQDSGPSAGGGGGGSGGGGGGNGGGGGGNTSSSNNSNSGGWTRVFYSAHPYPSHPFPYQPDCLHAGSMEQKKAATTTPAVVNSKRLRLFGVNMECQLDDEQSSEPPTPDGSSLSSQGQAHHHLYYPESHNHMDVNFSRDVHHMINRQG